MIKLKIVNGHLILGNQMLEGVERHQIKISSEMPKDTAELELKMIVNFVGNTQEQNPLPIQKE